jgi:hypothetical protein
MGMSFFPTKKRKWPGFCERKHNTKNGEEPEYYYRMVVCNLLNTQIDLPLDTEPILAGENEVAAARRIVERLCDNYTHFFDVVVTDALYMEGPFVNYYYRPKGWGQKRFHGFIALRQQHVVVF